MARATRAGSSAGFPELNRRGGARGSVPADIMMPRLGLLVAVVLLVLIGIVMVFSASTVEAIHNGESATSYVVKQTTFVVLGSALALFVYTRDYRSLQGGPYFWVFWGICAVPVIGTNILGATRWIYIGGFSVQPTEFAKIMLVVAAAKVLLEYRDQIRDRKQALIAAFALVLLPLLFLYKTQSDMGSAVVILVGAFVVMWLGGLPGRFVAVLGIAVVVAGVFGIVGYRADRVSVWLDPWSDQYDTGYQMIRSFFAFSEGGILGVGLGNSREKFLYLPEAETDFIFSIIGEELGLVGALFVIALFVAVLVCGLLIAKRAADDFGTMIAGGLTCMLVGQAFLNMACATGLFPTTGKPLPFISSGGSSVVASLLMVGIIMSVSRVAGEEALTPHRASAERRRANLNYIRVEDEPPARSRFSSSESAPVVDAPVRSRRSHGDPFGGLMAPRGGASRNASRGSSRPEGNASLGSRASRRNDSGMERGANRRGSGRNSR